MFKMSVTVSKVVEVMEKMGDALLIYLEANLEYIKNRLTKMPKIKPMDIQSTFLLWLDCKELHLDDKSLEAFFITEAKLGLNTGRSFGKGGEGFMRLNFAVPRSVLNRALDQLEMVYVKKEY